MLAGSRITPGGGIVGEGVGLAGSTVGVGMAGAAVGVGVEGGVAVEAQAARTRHAKPTRRTGFDCRVVSVIFVIVPNPTDGLARAETTASCSP